jgi:hypothetical protein
MHHDGLPAACGTLVPPPDGAQCTAVHAFAAAAASRELFDTPRGSHWSTALAVLKHGDMFVISSSQVPSPLRV